MIKVGKILEIREIFLIFFHFGWGFFLEHSEQLGALGALGALGLFGVGILGATRSTRSTRILEEMVGTGAWLGLALASFSECSECSECSDDKKVWGVGVGIFCW